MTRYFIFAGEASGDLHGSLLMKALRQNELSITFCGVGGPRMRSEGIDLFVEMENFQVMGFSDVVKALPRLWKLFYKIRDCILRTLPDCVILIDYPGFNLRLAQALRKSGFKGKIVQYICPTIWAHGKKRINVLNQYYDLLLTIFPFEASFFSKSTLQVEYIGNPISQTIQGHVYQTKWKTQFGLNENEEIIALFPGSRRAELQRHVPVQLQTAELLKRSYPDTKFAISCAQLSLKDQLISLIRKSNLQLNKDLFVIPPSFHYELMQGCKTALAKSGTVNLELALHGVPTVVHFELNLINFLCAKYLLKLQLPHYSIVNILMNERIFPELMGLKNSPLELKNQLELLHIDSFQRQTIKSACKKLIQQLGKQSSSELAAHAIQKMLSINNFKN